MRLLKGLFDHARGHNRTSEMPGWIRRRIYRQLLSLLEEEQKIKQLLDLPIEPRLSVVDEERVAMLRPADRQYLGLDKELQNAREQLAAEKRAAVLP